MNSSTSNSKNIYPRIALIVIGGMAAAMGLVRLFIWANDIGLGPVMYRVDEARAALPQIVKEEKDLVMFFGSSMVQAGCSPRQFDAFLQEKDVAVKSFNFGFGGLNPMFQKYLANRIEDGFRAEDRRLAFTLIEFNPFQATVTRRGTATAIEDTFLTLLGSDRELWEIALKDPDRGARLFNIRYLRDSVSAEMITYGITREFRDRPPAFEGSEDEAIVQRRREIGEELNKRFEAEYPDYQPSSWSYEWQGGGTIPDERPADTLALFDEYYQTLITPYRLESARLRRIQRADILDLNFDEELVASFIEIVKTFQRFSDNVEVVLLPRNTKWIENTPDGLVRLNTVLARIEAETGLPVRNYQDLESIDHTMFRDATHLNRYQGATAFTRFLADTYAPLLKEPTP